MRMIFVFSLSAAFLLPQIASAQGDAAQGARMFLQCRACHTVGAAEKSGVGPNLNGVVGAKAASRSGYSYSPSLIKSGIVWTSAKLDAFLTRPSAIIPGNKMVFGGVANPKNRADIVAYLATLKTAK